uniref:Uncharacterized protein n=1 Tax=Mycobacterium sp. (strain JLS) TaxID=164757 RepID=A0A5Q5CLA1_MYCSJ
MDLNRWLAKCAARRPHVFLAELPGNWALRVATQNLIAARGWRQAVSPADADVLAVCGTAADDEFDDLIDRLWDQLPGPRARVDIRDLSATSSQLDRAAGVLIDTRWQRTDALNRTQSAAPMPQHDAGTEAHHMPHSATGHGHPADNVSSETAHGGDDANGHDGSDDHATHDQKRQGDASPHGGSDRHHPEQDSHEPTDHSAHQHHDHGAHGDPGEDGHHDMGHSGHHHMDHSDMDMAPAGIALAQGGEDRDGLEMDALHVRLGPFLAYWPAGLMLRCALQGDVITAAQPHLMGAASNEQPQPPLGSWMQAARHTDHVIDLLVLAGWPRAAARARRLRQVLLDDPVDNLEASKQADALATVVRRSRVLRWALRDLAPIAGDDSDRYGLAAALGGDTYDRLLTRLDVVQRAVRDEADAAQLHVPDSAVEHMLPDLVEGLDLATARLVIAGLGIELSPAERGHHA